MEITKDIIRKCKRGNRKSQKLIFETLYSPIMKTCMAYSPCEDQAKEYLQQAFIKIFKNIKQYNSKGAFEAWANTITRNLILDDLRKEKKLVYVEEYYNVSNEEVGVPYEVAERLDAKQLFNALHSLAPGYRTVFSMKILDGLTHKEIAEELGIHEGTSKSNYFKAREKLKEILSEV